MWVKYIVVVAPLQKTIRIERFSHPNRKRIMRGERKILHVMPLMEDIQKVEHKVRTEWFDLSGLQSDDRFGVEERTLMVYDQNQIKDIQNRILDEYGYPHEPIEVL